MQLTIQYRLKTYRKSMQIWIEQNGLNGGGGPWIATERRYPFRSEPVAPVESDFEKKVFAAAREAAVKDYAK